MNDKKLMIKSKGILNQIDWLIGCDRSIMYYFYMLE